MKYKEQWKVYKNVFSEFSTRNLFKLSSQGHFEELESPISIGKEANIITAKTKDGQRIVVKIYRLENCNFNKMYYYIASDSRYHSLKKRKREIVFAWTQREYRNLILARDAIKVPTPIAFKDNIILLEFIGDNNPAPQLNKAIPKNKKKFFEKIIANMKNLYRRGLVHGDLSPFNILNHKEEPVFIDFSQSVTLESVMADELLDRDIKNICDFFSKFFNVDKEKIKRKITNKTKK